MCECVQVDDSTAVFTKREWGSAKWCKGKERGLLKWWGERKKVWTDWTHCWVLKLEGVVVGLDVCMYVAHAKLK